MKEPIGFLDIRYRQKGINYYLQSPTARLCILNGSAFARVSEEDLTNHLAKKVVFVDTSAREATGYVKEADAGEALVEQLVDGDCSSDAFTKGTGWTYDAGNQEYDGAAGTAGNLTQAVGAVGKLYKFTVTIANYVAGSLGWSAGTGTGAAWAADATTSAYATCIGNTSVGFRKNAAGDLSGDDMKAEEVTHVGADGVHIVSASGGATRNWASIDSGFDANNIASVYVY